MTYNLRVEKKDSDDEDLQTCTGGMTKVKPGVSGCRYKKNKKYSLFKRKN